MSNYSYKAKNQYNEIIQGSINAQNITDAAVKLENQGYVVLEIKEFNEIKKHYVSSSFKNYNNSLKPFSLQEKKDFISSFYSLYKSGLSVNEIFSSILNSSKNPNIKEFCARISHKTEKGYSLKEAIKNNRNILGNAYTALICAGEESGKLDKVLNNLIRNLEREEEIKNNIISAVSYPIFIIILGIFVFCLFNFFILQIFNFAAQGEDYSIQETAISAGIKTAVIYLVLGTFVFIVYKMNLMMKFFNNVLYRIKPFNSLIKNYTYTNFFSIFGLAYAAGIPVAEAISLANTAINIAEEKLKLNKASDMIASGCEVTTAISVANVFPSSVISKISAGEASGELEESLIRISNDYENKLELEIKILIKLLNPIILVIVGIFVAFIMAKCYMNYFNSIFSIIN